MPSDKDRLYVVLYARGGQSKLPGHEDAYHWALVVGPKNELENSQGHRFHAKQKVTGVDDVPKAQLVWRFEGIEISMLPSSMQLVRVLVGKVNNLRRLQSIFEQTPVRPGTQGWNCIEWVKEALLAAIQDGNALGTCISDWASIRDTVMWYIEHKKAGHRFDSVVSHDRKKAATWDMLEGVETTE